jgi:predicted RND superfamily exporter protein
VNRVVRAIVAHASIMVVAISLAGAATEARFAPLTASLFSLCAAFGLVIFVALSLTPPSSPDAPERI